MAPDLLTFCRILTAAGSLALLPACVSAPPVLLDFRLVGSVHTPPSTPADPAAWAEASRRGRPVVPPAGIVWHLELDAVGAGDDFAPAWRLRWTMLDARQPAERIGERIEPDVDGMVLLDDRGRRFTPASGTGRETADGDAGGSRQTARGRQSSTREIRFPLEPGSMPDFDDVRYLVLQWRLLGPGEAVTRISSHFRPRRTRRSTR